jgi:hypothetical protein
MFFKKQLVFSLFIFVILIFILYKQYENSRILKESVITEVEIINMYCSNRLSKNNYSYFEFRYDNKIYKQRVGKSKCVEISKKESIELEYNSDVDIFLLPAFKKANYYKKYIIIILIFLGFGLIPYKKILK